MNSVHIRGISKSFGGTAVLRDINLDVEAGSFTTLLGPSGCGKTTLLRIIAGLERPDTGSVTAGTQTFVDVEKGVFTPPQRRKLGFVFQDYGLWPHMTVAQNVSFPLKMAKTPKPEISDRVEEVLAAVQLSDQINKIPEQLSGGQKQRVSIARALAARPKVILFDEPLSNLDANLREELGHEIRVLSKRLGLTCINVTHDRREAQILSDHIALMKDGNIHQLGNPKDIFCDPVDLWAARFLDAGNILPHDKMMESDINIPPSHPDTGETHILVPRGSIQLSTTTKGLKALVLNSIYIDDRYEITADLDGHVVKMFSHQDVTVGQSVVLKVDPMDLSFFSVGT